MKKRLICLALVIAMCLSLVACGSSDDHIGEAKTPSEASTMQGRKYQEVVEIFEEKGFTNIKTEKIEDLVFGLFTDDGEVEKVSVGGDEEYSPYQWVPADTEVMIYYHTFPVEEKIVMPYSSVDYCGEDWTLEELTEHLTELGYTNLSAVACDPDDRRYKSNIFEVTIETGLFSAGPWEAGEEFKADAEISIYYNEFPLLTVENCPDLWAVLYNKEASGEDFAIKYDGRYVEFEACIYKNEVASITLDRTITVTGKFDAEGETSGQVIHIGGLWG